MKLYWNKFTHNLFNVLSEIGIINRFNKRYYDMVESLEYSLMFSVVW